MSRKENRPYRSKSVHKEFIVQELSADQISGRLRSQSVAVDDPWNPFPDFILKRTPLSKDSVQVDESKLSSLEEINLPEKTRNEKRNLSVECNRESRKKQKYFQNKNKSARRLSYIANDILSKKSDTQFQIGSNILRRSVSIDRTPSIEEEPNSGSQSDLSIDFSVAPDSEGNKSSFSHSRSEIQYDCDDVVTPTTTSDASKGVFPCDNRTHPDFGMRSFSATFSPAILEEDSGYATTPNQTVNKKVVTSMSASNLRESSETAAGSSSSNKDYQRNMVINELFLTEKSYCDNLNTLVKLIMETFRKSGQFSNKELNLLFPSSLTKIYEIHSKFLQRLEVWSLRNSTLNRTTTNSRITAAGSVPYQDVSTRRLGDPPSLLFDMLLNNNAEILSFYSGYLTDFPGAVDALSKLTKGSAKVRKIIRDLRSDSHCGGLETSAFLLTPVQRLPRYLLLANQMLKHCEENSQSISLLNKIKKTLENFLEKVDDSLQTALKTPQQKKKRRLRTLFAGSMDSLHMAGTIPHSQIYSPPLGNQESIGNTTDNSTVVRSGVLGKLRTRQRISNNNQAPRRNSVVITMPSTSPNPSGSSTPNFSISNGHYLHQMSLMRSSAGSSNFSPAFPKQRPNSICQMPNPPIKRHPNGTTPVVNRNNRRSSDLTNFCSNPDGMRKLLEESSPPVRKYSMDTLNEGRPIADTVLHQIEEHVEIASSEPSLPIPFHAKSRSAPVDPLTITKSSCQTKPPNKASKTNQISENTESKNSSNQSSVVRRYSSSSSSSSTGSSIDSQPSTPLQKPKISSAVISKKTIQVQSEILPSSPSSSDCDSDSASVTDSHLSSSSSLSSGGRPQVSSPKLTTTREIKPKSKPHNTSPSNASKEKQPPSQVTSTVKEVLSPPLPPKSSAKSEVKSQSSLSQLTEEIIKPGIILPVSPKQRPQTKFMTSSAASKSPVKKTLGREQLALHHRQSYMAAMEAGEDRKQENRLLNKKSSPSRNIPSPQTSSTGGSSLTSASSQSSGINSISRFSDDKLATTSSSRSFSSRASPQSCQRWPESSKRVESPGNPNLIQRFKGAHSTSQANISVNSSDSDRISIKDTFRKVFQLRKKPDRRLRAGYVPTESRIQEATPQINRKGPYSPKMP